MVTPWPTCMMNRSQSVHGDAAGEKVFQVLQSDCEMAGQRSSPAAPATPPARKLLFLLRGQLQQVVDSHRHPLGLR